MIFITYLDTDNIHFLKVSIMSLLTLSLFIIPYSTWTIRWMRPTKYEIENGYLDD